MLHVEQPSTSTSTRRSIPWSRTHSSPLPTTSTSTSSNDNNNNSSSSRNSRTRVLPAPTPHHGRRLCLHFGPDYDDTGGCGDSIAPCRTSTNPACAGILTNAAASAAARPRVTRAALAPNERGHAVAAVAWPTLADAPTEQERNDQLTNLAQPSPDFDGDSSTEVDDVDDAPTSDRTQIHQRMESGTQRKRALLEHVPTLFPPHSPSPDRRSALAPVNMDIVGRILAPPAMALPLGLSAGSAAESRSRPSTTSQPPPHETDHSTSSRSGGRSGRRHSSTPPTDPELEYPLTLTLAHRSKAASLDDARKLRTQGSSAARLRTYPSSAHGPSLHWPEASKPVWENSLAHHQNRLANITSWLAGSDEEDSDAGSTPTHTQTHFNSKSKLETKQHLSLATPTPTKKRKLSFRSKVPKAPPTPKLPPVEEKSKSKDDAAPHPMVAHVLSRRAWDLDQAKRHQAAMLPEQPVPCTPRISARTVQSASAVRRKGVPPRTPMGRDRYVLYDGPTPLPLSLNRKGRTRDSESDLSLDRAECFCGMPDNVQPMVQCDACQHWFHQPCVGFQEQDDEDLAWYCNGCMVRADRARKEALGFNASLPKGTATPEGFRRPAPLGQHRTRPSIGQSPITPGLPWMTSAPWSAQSPGTPFYLRSTGGFMEESDLRSLPTADDKPKYSPSNSRIPHSPGSPLARKVSPGTPLPLLPPSPSGRTDFRSLDPPLTPSWGRTFQGPIYTARARARALQGQGEAADLPLGCTSAQNIGSTDVQDDHAAAQTLALLHTDWTSSPAQQPWNISRSNAAPTPTPGPRFLSSGLTLTAGKRPHESSETQEQHLETDLPDLFSTPSRLPTARPVLWTDASPSLAHEPKMDTGRWSLHTPSRPIRMANTPLWPPSASSIHTPTSRGSTDRVRFSPGWTGTVRGRSRATPTRTGGTPGTQSSVSSVRRTHNHMVSSPATSLPALPSSAASQWARKGVPEPLSEEDEGESNGVWLLASPSASANRRLHARVHP